jgi:hypothetical protein
MSRSESASWGDGQPDPPPRRFSNSGLTCSSSQNRALDGLDVVVVLRGRGFDNVGFPEGTAVIAEHLLTRAVLSLRADRLKEKT